MTEKQHSHYFKDVTHYDHVDIYRILRLYDVTDPCIAHAIKKLLVAGGRGAKDTEKDVKEAADSCLRYLEMVKEDRKNHTAKRGALRSEQSRDES